ncbi:hypothetical protein ABK040_002865 [Willaertia magna]
MPQPSSLNNNNNTHNFTVNNKYVDKNNNMNNNNNKNNNTSNNHTTNQYFPNNPKLSFIVNDQGHLTLKNKRTETAFPNPLTTSNNNNNDQLSYTSPTNFSFTPVGYYSHQVKPNQVLIGVRPGLRDTNPTAHQYLKKHENVEQFNFSSTTHTSTFNKSK